jgi:hypothetical protein
VVLHAHNTRAEVRRLLSCTLHALQTLGLAPSQAKEQAKGRAQAAELIMSLERSKL